MPAPDTCNETFESSLAELDAIVHALEDGQLGLAESLERYECGIKHLKRCYQLLQAAERKIELLTAVDPAGNATTQPFDTTAAPLEEQAGTRRRSRSPKAATAKVSSLPADSSENDELDASPGLF